MNLQSYREYQDSVGGYQVGLRSVPASDIDLRWIISAILQHRWMIVLVPLLFMALATAYVIVRPPSYTATTQLQLTNLRLTFIREDAFFAETHPDPSFLETQLQIIRSDHVATSVLNNLRMISADASTGDMAKALKDLRRTFSADRAGQSNVVFISYSASDPEVAARIANEFARAYIADQNIARGDVAQAGSSWLRERLREVGPRSRVIAEALPPQEKSNIRGILIIAASGAVGGLVAVSGALLWKFADRRVSSPEEAAAATGVPCLGVVPRLPRSKPGRLSTSVKAEASESNSSDIPETARTETLGSRYAGCFQINANHPTFALDPQLSEAWHTVRNIVAACQDGIDGKALRYLAVTSMFSREGRSTIAANLALGLAASNARVLLVDSDIYDPALSNDYAGSGRTGLTDYLATPQDSLAKYILVEANSGLHFLPIGRGVSKNSVANIWTEDMERFFAETTTTYDHVIFDAPTMSALGDIRAAARYLNGFLLVIGWRKVTADALRIGMTAAVGVSDKLIGAVLNDVEFVKMRWVLSPRLAFARQQRRKSGA